MKFKLVESKEDQQKLIDYIGDKDLANEYLNIYRHRLKLPYNDLYYWLDKPIQDFKTLIYRLQKKDGLVYEDGQWKVYKIKNPEMLTNLIGRHKIWCIQNRNTGLDWDFHAEKQGTKYILYIDKINNKKYIRGINEDNFIEDGLWDENNHQIRDKQFIKSLPQVEI